MVLQQLKDVLHQMGQGLAHQDLDEMSPTAEKIANIEQRSRRYRSSGEQGRIVLVASRDPLGPAFDLVVELAKHTKSLIEVLYVRPADEKKSCHLSEMLDRLRLLACDFQITFLRCDLSEKLADYHTQRQDVMAVICSRGEVFAKQLAGSQTAQTVLLIGGGFMA